MIGCYKEWFIVCTVCGTDGSQDGDLYSTKGVRELKMLAKDKGWKINPEICPRCQEEEEGKE